MTDKLPFSVSLVIPLYNNQKTLSSQLKTCRKILDRLCKNFEIIICEDKSTDKSKRILEKEFSNLPFKLLFHNKNLGIAKTMRELYKEAKFEYIVLFSVDGDWNPRDIERLLLSTKETKSDIVVGKRNPKNYTVHRRLISFFYNFLSFVFFQVKTIDAGSIKVIRRKILETIPLKSKSVFADAELLIRASKKGYKINFVPIYFKKKERGSGSGAKLSLILSSIFDLIKLRFTLSS